MRSRTSSFAGFASGLCRAAAAGLETPLALGSAAGAGFSTSWAWRPRAAQKVREMIRFNMAYFPSKVFQGSVLASLPSWPSNATTE